MTADPAVSRRISLRLAYEGTRYSGWQAQPGRSTVQGALAEAIRQVSGETVVPRGASRTDAGVHALDQLVAFTTTGELSAETWVRALNARLPSDISVIAGCEAPADFDPVVAAVRDAARPAAPAVLQVQRPRVAQHAPARLLAAVDDHAAVAVRERRGVAPPRRRGQRRRPRALRGCNGLCEGLLDAVCDLHGPTPSFVILDCQM
jgi:hypothetical protein